MSDKTTLWRKVRLLKRRVTSLEMQVERLREQLDVARLAHARCGLDQVRCVCGAGDGDEHDLDWHEATGPASPPAQPSDLGTGARTP